MSGPAVPEDLDALEAFYSSRGCEACVRVCPHADASLVRLLGERGYALRAFMDVYACLLAMPSLRATPPRGGDPGRYGR